MSEEDRRLELTETQLKIAAVNFADCCDMISEKICVGGKDTYKSYADSLFIAAKKYAKAKTKKEIDNGT